MQEPEPREILALLAKHLQKLNLPLPVNGQDVPVKWAKKAADNIEKYLSGEEDSLDAAFDLKKKRGRPTDPSTRKMIARLARSRRKENKTWNEIKNELEASENIFKDESIIREYFHEFEHELMIEEATENIAKDLTSGGK